MFQKSELPPVAEIEQVRQMLMDSNGSRVTTIAGRHVSNVAELDSAVASNRIHESTLPANNVGQLNAQQVACAHVLKIFTAVLSTEEK